MDIWKFLLLALMVGAFCIAVTLSLVFVLRIIAWLFTMGRKTAKHNPWNGPRR